MSHYQLVPQKFCTTLSTGAAEILHHIINWCRRNSAPHCQMVPQKFCTTLSTGAAEILHHIINWCHRNSAPSYELVPQKFCTIWRGAYKKPWVILDRLLDSPNKFPCSTRTCTFYKQTMRSRNHLGLYSMYPFKLSTGNQVLQIKGNCWRWTFVEETAKDCVKSKKIDQICLVEKLKSFMVVAHDQCFSPRLWKLW